MESNQFDGLLALKTVAEYKSFSRAAKELGVTPPAISQMIKQLETRLGVALFNRTTRSTSLTEAGAQFLNLAGASMDQILTALKTVGSYAEKPSGLLRLNMPRIVFSNYLSPIVTSFMKKYPEIAVECFLEDGSSDVVANGFDAGIRLSDILMDDMVAIKLYGPIRFVIAGAPKYLNKTSRPKHPKDLLNHNCILLRLGADRLYNGWEFEHRGSDFKVHVKGSLILNDSLMTKKAAMEGVGLIYTAEDTVREEVKAGKLEIVLNQFAATSAGFYLYYPQRSQVSPKLREFIEHVRAELKKK